jgi:hypothetical protein
MHSNVHEKNLSSFNWRITSKSYFKQLICHILFLLEAYMTVLSLVIKVIVATWRAKSTTLVVLWLPLVVEKGKGLYVI